MLFVGVPRIVSYNFEIDFRWRIGLVLQAQSSSTLTLPGCMNDLMFHLAVLNQDSFFGVIGRGSFFGVVGSADAMMSGLLNQQEELDKRNRAILQMGNLWHDLSS